MEIFVFEYACGGGVRDSLESSILVEGFSMLRLVVEELRKCGVSVVTTLDSRIKECAQLNADKIYDIHPGEDVLEKIEDISRRADSTYLIAPGPELLRLARFLESKGISHLSSNVSAIEVTLDKGETAIALKRAGLPVPEIYEEGNVKFPCVVKPVDGVGCTDTYLLYSQEDFQKAKGKLGSRFILQEYIEGIDASVTLVSNGREAMPISLNHQNVHLSTPDNRSRYRGGFTPLDNELSGECMDVARKAVESISGLKGIVGVDLVIGDEPYVMEINPRLTTSVIGLCQIGDIDFLEAIRGSLNKRPHLAGCAYFSHIFSRREVILSKNLIEDVASIRGVWTPPISYYGKIKKGESLAFGLSVGKDNEDAKIRFDMLENSVLEVIS